MVPGVLHPLCRVSLCRVSLSIGTVPPPNMVLINARSVVNKTFLQNDFFSSHNLDFMFMNESWIKDLTPFSELVPVDCTFFHLTVHSKWTRGWASDSDGPICLEVIYRPPHSVKDFLQQFTDFIGNIVTKFYRFLLVGDFNIHVCCQSNPLSREFLNIIYACNLIQSVKGPTHIHVHTLDLVLSYGVYITYITVSDFMLSDHKPILFSMSLPSLSHVSTKAPSLSRVYSP